MPLPPEIVRNFRISRREITFIAYGDVILRCKITGGGMPPPYDCVCGYHAKQQFITFH